MITSKNVEDKIKEKTGNAVKLYYKEGDWLFVGTFGEFPLVRRSRVSRLKHLTLDQWVTKFEEVWKP